MTWRPCAIALAAALVLCGGTVSAQDCSSGNDDRARAAAFVRDFAVPSPSVTEFICGLPSGGVADNWSPVHNILFDAQQGFWVDWKDGIPSLLDEDHLYPYLQQFLSERGVQPLRSWEREAILNAVNPGWRSDFYVVLDTADELKGYQLLREVVRNRGRDLLVYDIGADGWGLLIGPAGASAAWAGQSIGYARVFSLEGFFADQTR